MTAPAIHVRGLTHRYDDHLAVDNVDLDIERGESFGLLGPNGAGKTTTIRVLDTLLPIQQGHVEIFGIDLAAHPMDVRYTLGYVPQQVSIDGSLTARENVTWFARLYDVPRVERRGRVDEVLDAMDLAGVADTVASRLSGGMVRRLELAQALVSHPQLLLLDEPTVGLDPIARDAVWQRVGTLRKRFGMTVLLTTHYMEEAEALCDRVGLMSHGRLHTVGTPAALEADLGPGATLDDVFRAVAGAELTVANDEMKGGLGNVRRSRRR